MRVYYVVFTAIISLLIFSSCRYRLYNDNIEVSFSDALPPDNIPTSLSSEDISEDESLEYYEELTPLTYIEAIPNELSPLTLEIVNEDARQYGSEDSEFSEGNVGVGNLDSVTSNIVYFEELIDDGDSASTLADGGGVVAIITSHSAMLNQAIGSLQPCQMYNIYAETVTDYVTVNRGSSIYQLMVNSGGLNVSSRLTPDRLTVTDDWVINRNPDIIVKFVDSTVLGSGVTDTHVASELRFAIISRAGWGAIEAISNNRIILLSEQMLESDETQLVAKLLISRLMYPTLFSDIDIDSLIDELMGQTEGVYVYSG